MNHLRTRQGQQNHLEPQKRQLHAARDNLNKPDTLRGGARARKPSVTGHEIHPAEGIKKG